MDKHSDVRRFLKAIFPEHEAHAIFANLNPPAHTRDVTELDPQRDCYWSIAAFGPDAKTNLGDDALHTVALVIDDVGTKVPEGAVRLALGTPTTVVRTSAGNTQWGYRLSKPVAVNDWPGFFGGVEALIGHPLEARGAQTLMRLPMGRNTKPDRGNVVELAAVHPDAEIDPDTIPRAHAKITKGSREAAGGDWGLAHLRALLALVPNTYERAGWIEIGHGLKALAADDAEGFLAFDAWSATHASYDAVATRKAWDSFGAGAGLLTQGGRLKALAEGRHPSRFAAIVFDDGADLPPPEPPGVKRAGITATPFKWMDLARTAPRDWLYGDILLRKFISMTVAPGGVGKSSLVAVETLAQVTGKALLGEDPSDELRVWLWNLEDPYEETQKRLLAAAKHHGVMEAEIGDRLFVDSGRDQRLVIAEMVGGTARVVRPVVGALVSQIRLRRIDIVVIDPFVSCHGVPENDNTAMDMVVKEWGRVAEEGNCAVHLVDHTRKAGADAEVSTESSRGAKAKTDAARVVRVVNRMSAADGKVFGILDTWRYFNTFNDKANMAPPKARRDWFRMESVWAGNGGGAAQAFSVGAAASPPLGDSVGVAVKWAPPSAKAMAGGDSFVKVAAAMKGKQWRADPRSPDWVGNAVATGCGLLRQSTSDLVTIKALIKTWISEGLFKITTLTGADRKAREYIEIVQVS